MTKSPLTDLLGRPAIAVIATGATRSGVRGYRLAGRRTKSFFQRLSGLNLFTYTLKAIGIEHLSVRKWESRMAKPVEIAELDFERAFQDMPVGQAIGRNRVICACNKTFAQIFRGHQSELVGHTFARLYPTETHFESTGARVGFMLGRKRVYSDDRVMRRLNGELFWAHVRGFAYTPSDPHKNTLWVFTELSNRSESNTTIRGSLTPRERDIAALLIEGYSGKEVARSLGISPRTVDIYRSRLLRKYNVSNTPDLITRLLKD